MDRSVNSVDPNQIAPKRAMKRRLGSERCEVGALISGCKVTLPSHKGALCRRRELCAEGRRVCVWGGGEGLRGGFPPHFSGVRGISPEKSLRFRTSLYAI